MFAEHSTKFTPRCNYQVVSFDFPIYLVTPFCTDLPCKNKPDSLCCVPDTGAHTNWAERGAINPTV